MRGMQNYVDVAEKFEVRPTDDIAKKVFSHLKSFSGSSRLRHSFSGDNKHYKFSRRDIPICISQTIFSA